jgi:hypothetical protein
MDLSSFDKKIGLKNEADLKKLLTGVNFNASENPELKSFINVYGKGKGATVKFRHHFTKEDEAEKDEDKFVKHIAYYWLLLETIYDLNFRVSIDESVPILITANNNSLFFPEHFNLETEDYLCFYPRSKTDLTSKIGVMEINMSHLKTDDKNVRSGVFNLAAYYRNSTIDIFGRWLEQGNLMFLRTKRRSTGKIKTVNNKKMDDLALNRIIHTQINLQKNPENENYILGEMLSANREQEFTFAASVVLIKKRFFEIEFLKSKKADAKFLREVALHGKNIPSEVVFYLMYKRLSTYHEGFFNVLNSTLPISKQALALKKIAGKYIENRLVQRSSNDIYIDHSAIEILKNGMVININSENENKDGMIKYINTDLQNGAYKLLIHMGIDEDTGTHQQTICLETDSLNSDYLKGAFLIGLGESPSAGKVYYKKVTEFDKLPEPSLFEPQNMKWNGNTEIAEFFNRDRSVLPGFVPFIPLSPIMLPAFLPTELSIFCFTKETTGDNNEMFPNRHPYIIKLNLNLENNQFKLFQCDNSLVHGNIKYKNSKLVLQSYDSEQYETFHFSLSTPLKSDKEFSHAFGTQTLFLDTGNCESRAAILMAVHNPDKSSEIFDINDCINFVKNDSNSNIVVALKFLMGTEINRMIRMPKIVNKEEQERYELYRHLYFYAADY